MITIPGRIPIYIHPFFWLLIGWMSTGSFLGMALWAIVIFFSVLFHEYGHALTALAFGQMARIDLIITGGLTQRSGTPLKLWQEFLVILNGPLFGFILAGIAFALINMLNLEHRPIIATLLNIAFSVNLFWTVINLLPIQPLDGGRLLTVFMEMILGLRGVKISLFISTAVAVVLTGYLFYINELLAGSILFLFMYESYRSWRSSLDLTEQDQNSSLQDQLNQAEEAYRSGRLAEAIERLQALRKEAGSGTLYTTATVYLANIFGNQKQEDQALALLEPLKSRLPLEGGMLLMQLYYKAHRYSDAIAIGHPLYQERGGYDVALLNAFCHAQLGDARAAVGWLQSAIRDGVPNPESYLSRADFDSIRQDPEFQRIHL
ncbi:MAG: site-2 protease family protein [Parachlamydia sp.]|nr:site-2 protease family protein [Parachlamydia sp.]